MYQFGCWSYKVHVALHLMDFTSCHNYKQFYTETAELD